MMANRHGNEKGIELGSSLRFDTNPGTIPSGCQILSNQALKYSIDRDVAGIDNVTGVWEASRVCEWGSRTAVQCCDVGKMQCTG